MVDHLLLGLNLIGGLSAWLLTKGGLEVQMAFKQVSDFVTLFFCHVKSFIAHIHIVIELLIVNSCVRFQEKGSFFIIKTRDLETTRDGTLSQPARTSRLPARIIAACLEVHAGYLEVPLRVASRSHVRVASRSQGRNFETKIFNFRWCFGPFDRNKRYHTPLLSKI